MTSSQVVLLAAGCLAVALPLLAWSLTARPGQVRQKALANLQRDLAPAGPAAVNISGGGLASVARVVAPGWELRQLDRLHAGAGRPSVWPIERVAVSKVILAAAGGALAVLTVLANPGPRTILLGVVLVTFGWFLPNILLYNEATKRRRRIAEALPDTLDQLSIAVEAGLGFEGAMAHVARHSKGPLADELARTLQDIQLGQPRNQAYLLLAERTAEPDLARFVRAINQAERHGVSIGRVLSAQAQEMRLKRRQRAEERAMKIPVKVVFPLMLFILPALFIIVLGPAVLNIVQQFSGGLINVP